MQVTEKSSFLYYTGRFLFKIMFLFIFRCKSEGKENIPKNTGIIISPNHISFFDPPLTGCFMDKDLYFMAKQELFDIPILGFLIKRTNAFAVKRGMQDMSAFRNAFSLLENKKALLMFPEGTRSKDGNIGKARAGVGMVSCIAQVPIVPARITNTNNMKFFKKITIKYGKPIYPQKEYTKDDYLLLSQKVLDEIQKI
jgi:1-acyl-sn-glycerol-3-phosphate acyltransferase